MSVHREFDIPILIAGGGPVGMTLALELARYGVPTMLVEKNPQTTRHPKMDITNGRSMELFRRLDVVDALRSVGVPASNPFDVSWVTRLVGHELHRFRYESSEEFGKRIRRDNDGSQPVEPPLRVSQVVIEPVLKAAVDANPLIDVRFGTRLSGIVSSDDDGVVSELITLDGERRIVRSMYLAGCDGGGSTARSDAGIKLEGEFEFARAFMVHFHSEERELLQRWGKTWHYQNGFGSLIAQNDKDIWTLQAWILPGMDETAMTAEDVLEGWVGRPFRYEILQANPWGAHFVVAERYFSGRIVLAGDAAHQYVPTGGYGMNSGIADAAGLGWILAALVQGWGGPQLIPAYDCERRPVAWNCLAASKRHMGVRIAIAEVYANSGDLEGEGPDVERRRLEAGQKIAALGNAENESWGVELGYRYDGSPIIFTDPSAPPVDPINYEGATWPGSRLPSVFLEDGSALHDHLGLQFTLLISGDAAVQPFVDASAATGIPVKLLNVRDPAAEKLFGHGLLLVRPDQHIVWRGLSAPLDCEHILRVAAGFETAHGATERAGDFTPSAANRTALA